MDLMYVSKSSYPHAINASEIKLPSLSERVEDIEPLAQHFIRTYAAKMNKPIPSVSEEFYKALNMHQWKGNVRELKNVIERKF